MNDLAFTRTFVVQCPLSFLQTPGNKSLTEIMTSTLTIVNDAVIVQHNHASIAMAPKEWLVIISSFQSAPY